MLTADLIGLTLSSLSTISETRRFAVLSCPDGSWLLELSEARSKLKPCGPQIKFWSSSSNAYVMEDLKWFHHMHFAYPWQLLQQSRSFRWYSRSADVLNLPAAYEENRDCPWASASYQPSFAFAALIQIVRNTEIHDWNSTSSSASGHSKKVILAFQNGPANLLIHKAIQIQDASWNSEMARFDSEFFIMNARQSLETPQCDSHHGNKQISRVHIVSSLSISLYSCVVRVMVPNNGRMKGPWRINCASNGSVIFSHYFREVHWACARLLTEDCMAYWICNRILAHSTYYDKIWIASAVHSTKWDLDSFGRANKDQFGFLWIIGRSMFEATGLIDSRFPPDTWRSMIGKSWIVAGLRAIGCSLREQMEFPEIGKISGTAPCKRHENIKSQTIALIGSRGSRVCFHAQPSASIDEISKGHDLWQFEVLQDIPQLLLVIILDPRHTWWQGKFRHSWIVCQKSGRVTIPDQGSLFRLWCLLRRKNSHPKSEWQQHDASPVALRILTAFIHREPPVEDGEYVRYLKKLAMNNIERFFHHRGKTEIKQFIEA